MSHRPWFGSAITLSVENWICIYWISGTLVTWNIVVQHFQYNVSSDIFVMKFTCESNKVFIAILICIMLYFALKPTYNLNCYVPITISHIYLFEALGLRDPPPSSSSHATSLWWSQSSRQHHGNRLRHWYQWWTSCVYWRSVWGYHCWRCGGWGYCHQGNG